LGGLFDDGPVFGDVVGSEGDAVFGENAMREMRAAFNNLGRPEKFRPAFQVLEDKFYKLENQTNAIGLVNRHIPFHPVKVEMKEVGRQAAQLTKKMFAAGKVAPTPTAKRFKKPRRVAALPAARAPKSVGETFEEGAKDAARTAGLVAGVAAVAVGGWLLTRKRGRR
jgi:hypothetical protein